MKLKEESEKVGLKLNIQKTKIMASGLITSWQIDGETVETVADFIFLGSKITADGDFSHEIKRCLLLGRKAMTNLDSILKSRDIANKGPSSQGYGLLWMWELDYKESWVPKNYAFELWCWRRLSRVLWTARRSNQSILKEISPGCSLEGLRLKLKFQNFGHLMGSWLIWKDPDAGKDWRQEGKGTTEVEMVGWYHQLNGHEFEWTPGVGDGQGGLACCSRWGCQQSDTTEQLNWTDLGQSIGSASR